MTRFFSMRLISIKFRQRFIFRVERMKTANKSRLTNNNSGRGVFSLFGKKNCLCVIKIQRVSTEWKGARCARSLHTYTRWQQKLFTPPVLLHSIVVRIMRARINDEKAGLICRWQLAKFEPMSRYAESRTSNNIAAIILRKRQIRQHNAYIHWIMHCWCS